MSTVTTTAAAENAVSIDANTKTGAVKVGASEGGWEKFLDWSERWWRFTLEWITANPYMTVVIALVFTVWRWQAHLTKTTLARHKIEYEEARQNARSRATPQKGRGRS